MTTTATRPARARRTPPVVSAVVAKQVDRAALPNAEAATYVGLAPATLKKYRVTGDGPSYVQIGSRIVYLVEDLDAWLRHGVVDLEVVRAEQVTLAGLEREQMRVALELPVEPVLLLALLPTAQLLLGLYRLSDTRVRSRAGRHFGAE